MDCFRFQDQDYKDKRKEYEQLWKEQQLAAALEKGAGVYNRPRRAALNNAMDNIQGKTTHAFHDAINASRAEALKQKQMQR